MDRDIIQAMLKCKSNAELSEFFNEHNIENFTAERVGVRMKLYFEPEVPGGKKDCVSFPLELFKPESYMPSSTLSWLNLLRRT